MNIFIISIGFLIASVNCAGVKDLPAKCISDFNKCALKTHNRMRALHQAAPLIEDASLQASASEYSNKMATTGKFLVNPEMKAKNIGQNLGHSFKARGLNLNKCGVIGRQYAENWYNEIESYKFDQARGEKTEHFTQVVWKNTKKIGCGLAIVSSGKKAYITCHYDGMGNIPGEFAANVVKNSGAYTKDESDADCIDSDE